MRNTTALNGLVWRFLGLVFLLAILGACGKYRVPRGFPKPDEMAKIMAELHMVESTLGFSSMRGSERRGEIYGSYKFVLQKHGLTTAEFDTIRKWYVERPDLYQDVYRLVLEELSRMEAEIRIYNDREKEARALAEKEAVEALLANLWQDSTSIRVAPEDSSDNRLPFRIPVDTLDLQGNMKLSAVYRFLRRDESRHPQIMLSAFYNDSVADTVYHSITHSFQQQVQEVQLTLKQDTFPHYIDGYLLLQDSLTSSAADVSDIRLRVVNDSTEQVAKVGSDEEGAGSLLKAETLRE